MGKQKFTSKSSAESFAKRTGAKVNDVRDDSNCDANYTVRPLISDRQGSKHRDNIEFDNHMADIQSDFEQDI